jgi:hypothetical protein
MSFLSGLFRLCSRLSGITPDPELDLLAADRVTTDLYPYSGDHDYLVRMYAEKQVHSGRMKIKFQFEHRGGDNYKAAMMDSAVNGYTPPEHSNLMLRDALRLLSDYVDSHERLSISPVPATLLEGEVSLFDALDLYARSQGQNSDFTEPKP